MSGDTFKRQSHNLVTTLKVEGVTSSSPGKIHQIPRGSAVKIYPTSAGTASVYSTQDVRSVSDGDNTNAEITGSTASQWEQWTAGDVTEVTAQEFKRPQQTVALVVTSGTWTMEVTA